MILTFKVYLDVFRIDIDILGDHSKQFFLQLWQVVRRCVGAPAFVRQNDLQPFFGYIGRGFFSARAKKTEKTSFTSEQTLEKTRLLVIDKAQRFLFTQITCDHVHVGL